MRYDDKNMKNALTDIINDRKNLVLFAVCLGLFCLIYGSCIIKQGLLADELADVQNKRITLYLAAGRYGLAFMRWVTGASSQSWAIGISVAIFISASLVLQTHLLELKNTYQKVGFFLIYMAVPQTAHVMEYSNQSDSVAVGIFCVSLAVLIQSREIKSSIVYVIAAMLLAFALGCYQSLGLYYVVLCASWYLMKCLKTTNKSHVARAVRMVLICAPALILYVVVNKLTKVCIEVPQELVDMVEHYRRGLINGYSFIGLDFYEKILYVGHFSKELISLLFSFDSFHFFYSLSVIPVAYLLFVYLRERRGLLLKWESLFYVGCLFVVWVGAYAIIYFFGNHNYGERGLCALPVSCAALWGIAWSRQTPFSRWIMYLLIGVGCFRSMYYANQLHTNINIRYSSNYINAHLIMREAEIMAKVHGIELTDGGIVVFVKEYATFNYLQDHSALRFIVPAGGAENMEYADMLKNMPCWPETGSMMVEKGKVIVNARNLSFL